MNSASGYDVQHIKVLIKGEGIHIVHKIHLVGSIWRKKTALSPIVEISPYPPSRSPSADTARMATFLSLPSLREEGSGITYVSWRENVSLAKSYEGDKIWCGPSNHL